MILIFTPFFILINYWELYRLKEAQMEKRLNFHYANPQSH
jgi:hypothetical protein